jgi:hypothetical protein
MKRTSRKPSRLSESLQRSLNSYALAASAAGVSLLALAQPLEAEIVYTKAYRHIPPNTSINLDLNHDGITDFTLFNNFYNTSFLKGVVFVRMWGNAVKGYELSSGRGSGSLASALGRDIDLQPNVGFLAGNSLVMAYSVKTSTSHRSGPWLNVKPSYLGLQFLVEGEIHMGWARLCVRCQHQECHVLLTGYAYETVSSQPIITGKVHGPDVITLEPGSLGALAAGHNGRK